MSPTPIAAINTEGFAAAGAAVDLLNRRDGIVAFYGPSGTGKSYAIATQLTLAATDHLVAACPSDPTPYQLLSAFLIATDPSTRPRGSEPRLRARLAASLPRAPLLVVDDAHNLTVPCLKLLRRLHLGPDATCPLLLVGEEPLAEIVLSQPWTRACTLDVVQVDALTPEDVAEAIPRCHPIFRDCDLHAILHIDRTFAQGRWSNWVRIIRVATWLRNRSRIDRLDAQAAELILAHVR